MSTEERQVFDSVISMLARNGDDFASALLVAVVEHVRKAVRSTKTAPDISGMSTADFARNLVGMTLVPGADVGTPGPNSAEAELRRIVNDLKVR